MQCLRLSPDRLFETTWCVNNVYTESNEIHVVQSFYSLKNFLTSAILVCGGLLNQGDHGTLSSPGYPGNYPHNRDCAWTVMVSPGMNIMFTFAVMALEHHDNCSYDYVEVRMALTL